MSILQEFYRSTIGKKIVVALSGTVLFGFVVGHMIGNLKTFGGIDPSTSNYKIDDYAHFLRVAGAQMLGEGGLLWGTRIVLLIALVLHVVNVIQLRSRNRASRKESYDSYHHSCSSFSARTMFYGGIFLFAFIIFHILHLTVGVVVTPFVEGAVYQNLYTGFQSVGVVIIYVLAVTFLAFHLSHGVWSLFQTLGIDSPTLNKPLRIFATVSSVLVGVGFALIPLAFAFGFLDAPR